MRYRQVDIVDCRHRQQVSNVAPASGNFLEIVESEQDMRRAPVVSDYHGASRRGFLGLAGILIELPAGKGGNGYGGPEST